MQKSDISCSISYCSVFIELGWDKSCDAWSAGCILYEIFAGQTLFPADVERDLVCLLLCLENLRKFFCWQLAFMQTIIGDFPPEFTKNKKYFAFKSILVPVGIARNETDFKRIKAFEKDLAQSRPLQVNSSV